MEPRIIKTEEQYQRALREVEKLAALDPELDSEEGGRLELLAKLIEDYERERFKFAKPDPIEAILFRMEQSGLRQKDLASSLGGKNRASEVLARKRPLTLPMIRALHEKLDIPAELLLREPSVEYRVDPDLHEDDMPLALATKRGWIPPGSSAAEMIRRFFAPPGSPVMLRKTTTFGATARTNRTHIWLWLARVREIADARSHVHGRYRSGILDADLLRYVVKLSYMENGPRNAVDFLESRGIAVVVEPHLPSTHLDGAAMFGRHGTPIIGLTLRHDRLDNFWFTLLHELVHAWKHLDPESRSAIADEEIERNADSDAMEHEANTEATEILLSTADWRRSDVFLNPSTKAIQSLASKLQISPAIVAGRIRHERRNYSSFSALVGYRKARIHWPEVNWHESGTP